MSPWGRLIERPTRQGHLVQFYDPASESVATNLTRYLHEGLSRGEGALVIASRNHVREFRRTLEELGTNVDSAERRDRLVFLDALDTLSTVLVDDEPDRDRFEPVIRAAMARVRAAVPFARLRAYTEMVGILWERRQFAAAIKVEQFWNRLLSRSSFSLYCGYAVDVFGQDFHGEVLDGVLRTHTHIMPAETNGRLDAAVDTAMAEILGPAALSLKPLIEGAIATAWGVMPPGESAVLWLRANLPRQSDQIMLRARRHFHFKPSGIAAQV